MKLLKLELKLYALKGIPMCFSNDRAWLSFAAVSHNRDVHALQLVDFLIRNLRKDQLIVQPDRVIPATVKRLARYSAKVAHARQDDVHQPVEKLVHAVARAA